MSRIGRWTRILMVASPVVAGAVLAFPQDVHAQVPASITLEKTVMVDTGADVCGTETALTVGVGTTVRYCYTVTNTGETTLDTHTLVDDQLGIILSDFSFVLEPGAQRVRSPSIAVITNTVTNTATWTATEQPTRDLRRRGHRLAHRHRHPTVDQPRQDRDGRHRSRLCGTDTALTVGVGTMVRYCYTVTNTGRNHH